MMGGREVEVEVEGEGEGSILGRPRSIMFALSFKVSIVPPLSLFPFRIPGPQTAQSTIYEAEPCAIVSQFTPFRGKEALIIVDPGPLL